MNRLFYSCMNCLSKCSKLILCLVVELGYLLLDYISEFTNMGLDLELELSKIQNIGWV